MKKLFAKGVVFLKVNLGLVLVLALFFVAHLHGITSPPLDEHAWRQTDTAAVARNFQEESANIFQPRIDMRQNYSGVTGMEFPLYNYVLAVSNIIIGFTHWHGRALTLVFSLVGLSFFYLLIRRRYSKGLANTAVAVMALSPLYFLFSKNIQPDILMVTLAIAALYYTQVFVDSKKDYAIYIAIAALSLAVLVKIPSIFIALPMAYTVGWKGIKRLVSLPFIIYGLVVLVLPNALWYWWSGYLSAHYGLGQYFYGDISLQGSLSLAKQKGFWRVISDYLMPMRFPANLIYIFALLGGVVAVIKKDYFGLIWFGSFLLFIGGFAIKSFYHNYYSLPLVPPLALIIAIGVYWLYQKLQQDSRLVGKFLIATAVIGMTFLFYNKSQNLYAAQAPLSYTKLEAVMDSVSQRGDLVATNGNGTPIALYFAHRKGWSLSHLNLVTPMMQDSLRQQGAQYVLVDLAYSDGAELTGQLDSQGFDAIYRDVNFVVYKL